MLTWWMVILLIIYVIICFLLMGAILLQSGKGGGLSSLASAGGGLTDAIGATGAEKTMNKITTAVAVGFMVMAIVLSLLGRYLGPGEGSSEIFGEGAAAVAPVVEEIPMPEPAGGEAAGVDAEAPLEPVIPSQAPELPVPVE